MGLVPGNLAVSFTSLSWLTEHTLEVSPLKRAHPEQFPRGFLENSIVGTLLSEKVVPFFIAVLLISKKVGNESRCQARVSCPLRTFFFPEVEFTLALVLFLQGK